jgi:hypothetical protein
MQAGLCDACRHQQVVGTTRGTAYSLCLRSKTDPAYPKYPRLPVLRCPGFEPRTGVSPSSSCSSGSPSGSD